MTSKTTSHGSDFIEKTRKMKEGMPVYRKFDGLRFQFITLKPSLSDADRWIENNKHHYYIRKVRGVGGVYAIYTRRKNRRR